MAELDHQTEKLSQTALFASNRVMPVDYSSERPTVTGRELHTALCVDTPYDKWFPRMAEYGFLEGKDYSTFLSDRSDGRPGKPRVDHKLSIAMAKEICMLQRTDRGKVCRQYFIDVETQWNSPEQVMSRALVLANQSLQRLQEQTAVMLPKAQYYDELCDRNLLTNFRDTAQLLGIKQTDFISYQIEQGMLYRSESGKLRPYAEYVDKGLYEIKESFNEKTEWKGTQTFVTMKGREYFLQAFRN